jgi:hypothetical protein
MISHFSSSSQNPFGFSSILLIQNLRAGMVIRSVDSLQEHVSIPRQNKSQKGGKN